eukprot:scaffold230157_cov17-Tisochrysis_lutea.AAC.1
MSSCARAYLTTGSLCLSLPLTELPCSAPSACFFCLLPLPELPAPPAQLPLPKLAADSHTFLVVLERGEGCCRLTPVVLFWGGGTAGCGGVMCNGVTFQEVQGQQQGCPALSQHGEEGLGQLGLTAAALPLQRSQALVFAGAQCTLKRISVGDAFLTKTLCNGTVQTVHSAEQSSSQAKPDLPRPSLLGRGNRQSIKPQWGVLQ